jgi:hypothetical protein
MAFGRLYWRRRCRGPIQQTKKQIQCKRTTNLNNTILPKNENKTIACQKKTKQDQKKLKQ